MKNFPLLMLSALLTISTVGYADDIDDCSPFTKPHMCPSLASLKAGGVGTGIILMNGQFYAGRRQKDYGTGNLWTFILGPIPAASGPLAYTTAVTVLPSLTYMFGPTCSPVHVWACAYNTPYGIPAVAATPPLPMNNLPLALN